MQKYKIIVILNLSIQIFVIGMIFRFAFVVEQMILIIPNLLGTLRPLISEDNRNDNSTDGPCQMAFPRKMNIYILSEWKNAPKRTPIHKSHNKRKCDERNVIAKNTAEKQKKHQPKYQSARPYMIRITSDQPRQKSTQNPQNQ